MAEQFEKNPTMGVNLENSYFSEDGQSGFGISAYGGRLSLKFWKKGEKSSDNRDNTLSLNINQTMIFNNMLKYLITTRHAAFSTGGAESYSELTNVWMNVDGVMNGQPMVFGVIRFDTVEIDGLRRLKMTVTRNTTVNSVVFCDKFLKNSLPTDSPFRTQYDVLESSFLRLCKDVDNYINFAWSQGAFNKLFTTIVKPSNGGGNKPSGGYNGGGNSYNNKPKPAPRTDFDHESPIFSDDDDF